MKKVALLSALFILFAFVLFAGSFTLESNTSYVLPVSGWNLKSGENNAVSKAFEPGFLEEVEAGWAFTDNFALTLSGGFGINEMTLCGSIKPYFVPVLVNARFSLNKIDRLVLYAKVGLGGYLRIDTIGKYIYLGPAAEVSLGAEVNLAAGLYLGLFSKLFVTMEVINALTLELDYVPFGLGIRYEF